ncbi:MAG: hypothetical protein R3E79_53455 [Caldilineaceae bacterium]
MQNLTTLKVKSQESLNRLVERAQQQPPEVQLWGVVAVSAVAGGIVVAAGAKGLLAVVGTLAVPPVALTVGALGGGILGWSFMQNQTAATAEQPRVAPAVAQI